MPLVTERTYPGDVIRWEAEPSYSREEVTFKSGSGSLKVGTVVGRITASGQYRASPNAAVVGDEGAEIAVGVLMADVDATATAAQGVIVRRLAIVNRSNLAFDTSVDDAAKRQAKVDQLAAAGIGIIAREGA